MAKANKYTIICNDDNSYNIQGESPDIVTESKDLLSFSLQYLYTILNPDEITLPASSKEKIKDTIKTFDFDKKDVKDLSDLIVKMGAKLDNRMMTYDNGVPKLWDDEDNL